jgi:hypothetical protein
VSSLVRFLFRSFVLLLFCARDGTQGLLDAR